MEYAGHRIVSHLNHSQGLLKRRAQASDVHFRPHLRMLSLHRAVNDQQACARDLSSAPQRGAKLLGCCVTDDMALIEACCWPPLLTVVRDFAWPRFGNPQEHFILILPVTPWEYAAVYISALSQSPLLEFVVLLK